MADQFFEKPILNSPYEYPARYWELDASGQPTNRIMEKRRTAEFITPIPKPKKRKTSKAQQEMIFDEGAGLSTEAQQYDPTPVINEIRRLADRSCAEVRQDRPEVSEPHCRRPRAVESQTAADRAETGHRLKETDKANLFVIFGEPDIDILPVPPSPSGRRAGGEGEGERIQVKINGVDVFHPQTGEVKSDGADGIAGWFIDTDYNEESFFVRHAYFLGANDPYKSLKTTLKAEINKEAWQSLHSDTSRPFDKPSSGRIAVKVINHLGDEVMKVFRVDAP